MKRTLLVLVLLALISGAVLAQDGDDKKKPETPWSSGTFSGLKFRALGPALMSGRVGDFAVDPRDPAHWYVAVCSGGVWETRNHGTTFTPIFDEEGSYSIGCVAIDPTNPNVVWVGSGENNSQRSVAYGDGIYKSLDGGRTWKNMGLGESMHIGEIIVHPTDDNVVYVAAMGPLWSPGGDRGVYRTTDGGETWDCVLAFDENTGAVCLEMDPRDPEVVYAASYQRRRHTWTLIDGGPGSAVHKTTDGGETWRKITKGLPGGDLGRIGLALAPRRPDTLYAIVEAVGDKGGFYRSRDAGENWERMNDYVSSSPQYYQEILVDPADPDRVYSLDTYFQVTEDGGKTWSRVSIDDKHVDDHALWIDPASSDHLRIGCDGGIYETWDRCATWRYYANLPVTQFYRVAVDDALPFYNVYGGTQDNNTQGGPSRTISRQGITNRDWFITVGGDGFEPAIEPGNPDIVYSQWQHGGLIRYDRRSGEQIDIQPQPAAGEAPRWNWDSAFIISPHSPQRLYFASQRVYRSDDRGDSWRAISSDLTAGVDRNTLPVMGRVWSIDSVAKNRSTSFYGNIVSLAESPLQEGLIWVGTDDGLIQLTRDGGASWTRIAKVGKVPAGSYVACLTPSLFDAGTVYACFDNHKQGDLKPYVYVSRDFGRSWTDLTGDLPARGTAYTLRQDHLDRDLLFVGTEFSVFFSVAGGNQWLELSAGLPVIKVPDLEIQRRESDLVLATFGRGFYILDDYSPLRHLRPADLQKPALLLPPRPAPRYIVWSELGWGARASQGADFYSAENPPFGAVFTYYLRDGLQTREDQRQEAEKKLVDAEQPVPYPTWDDLRAEEREEKPAVLLTVRDANGGILRRITGPTGKGFQRVAWDLRLPSTDPVDPVDPTEQSPWEAVGAGLLAPAGNYTVELHTRVQGRETLLAGPVPFEVRDLGLNPLAGDQQVKIAFEREVDDLGRRVEGAVRRWHLARQEVRRMQVAAAATPALGTAVIDELAELENMLRDLQITLEGDPTIAGREEATTPGLRERVGRVRDGLRGTTMGPTQTQRENLAVAASQYEVVEPALAQIVDVDLPALRTQLERAGAPYSGAGGAEPRVGWGEER